MALASLTNSLYQILSGLGGGNKTAAASQPSQNSTASTRTSTSTAPVVDVSKDRLDVTVPSETVKEPALPVVAYAPPVELSQAPAQALPQSSAVLAPVQAEEPELPAAPADFPAVAAALAQTAAEEPTLPLTSAEAAESASTDDEAAAPAAAAQTAAPTTTASTGSLVSAEIDAPAAIRVSTGATVEQASLSSDEERARAMAIKALDQERRLNIVSSLTDAAASSVAAQSQKAAAQASAEAVKSKRPALLVA